MLFHPKKLNSGGVVDLGASPPSEEQWRGERISAANANPVEENGLVAAEKHRKQADEDDNLVDELRNHG